MSRDTLLLLILLQKLIVTFSKYNLTDFMELRKKRSLVYQGGGFLQFSVAGIWPISFDDAADFKLLNCIAVLQSTYPLPTQPYDDKWILRKARDLQANLESTLAGNYGGDPWRKFIYKIIEDFMNKSGRHGRECLLRSICENAQISEHTDVYSQILGIVLTPYSDRDKDLDELYHEAKKAGQFGIDCLSTYSMCPYGHNILDQFITIT